MPSTAVHASRAEDALTLCAVAGYLPFFKIGGLERTCFFLCCECRRQVARTVKVTNETPRALWCQVQNTSTSDRGYSETDSTDGDGSRHALDSGTSCPAGERGASNPVVKGSLSVSTADTSSPIASRIPLARVTIVSWVLPEAELTARVCRWRDGVKEMRLGESGDMFSAVGMIQVLSFAEPSKPGWVRWPPGLKTIRFGINWDIDFDGARESWPDSVESLYLPWRFNQSLAGGGFRLPRGLREIDLGYIFNQLLVLVQWPPLLQKLTFSYWYGQTFGGVGFPAGLREIYLRGAFNREIDDVVWPKDLEILEFGHQFDQPLVSPRGVLGRRHALPAGLKRLNLGTAFNQPLNGSELPDGLEEFQLPRSFGFLSSVRWPFGLKKLCLRCAWGGGVGLPPNLESLKAGIFFNASLATIFWPSTLTVLDLGGAFNHPIGGAEGEASLLPDGLEELRLGRSFNTGIANVRLPLGLKRLIMEYSCKFNQDLSGVMWPPGLEELKLGNCFSKPVEGCIFPETLEKLSFGENVAYNCPLVLAYLAKGGTNISYNSSYPVSHLQALDWPRSLRCVQASSYRFYCREDFARWLVQRPIRM